MKVAFHSLGCKVNQNDAQSLKSLFQSKGYQIAPFEAGADVYVINTCSVTKIGEKKSAQLIRKAAHLSPGAIVVVTGCYAQTAPDVVAQIPGVNLVIGMADLPRIAELVEEFKASRRNVTSVNNIAEISDWVDLPAGDFMEKTRATLKVEEGCENFCSYCIVPYARGKVRSMPVERAKNEFCSLLERGYREIVLTGIHLGLYGKDINSNLYNLLKELTNLDGDFRIRLGSIEPGDFSDDLIKIIVNNEKICQHLHIPLQSGSDRILDLMNRRYICAYFAELLEKIRMQNPLMAIGTDLIVGFPGETGEDFATTVNFLGEQSFSRIHVFRFSPRPGTPAALFPNKVPIPVQEERSKKVQEMAREMSYNFLQKFINRQVKVLFEEKTKLGWEGLSGEYLKVIIKSNGDFKNLLSSVMVTGVEFSHLLAICND